MRRLLLCATLYLVAAFVVFAITIQPWGRGAMASIGAFLFGHEVARFSFWAVPRLEHWLRIHA